MSTLTSVSAGNGIRLRNSQGACLSANILRLQRYTVSFEIYDPYSSIQLSEVLRDFRITINGCLVYDGHAVVSSCTINNGSLFTCSASLGEGWKEVDFLEGYELNGGLVAGFDGFLDDLKCAHHVSADFKVNVVDMHELLVGMKHWLGQVKRTIRFMESTDRSSLEKQVIGEIEGRAMGELVPLLERFETAARDVKPADQPAHKYYAQRQLHPMILCSPFANRAYRKPLGYAGDYEMVNMMLRDTHEGNSLYAKLLNKVFLSMAPVQAHRNRIDYLFKTIKNEALRVAGEGRRLKVLNLGCGPAKELQRLLAQEEVSNHCDFTLLDFNKETLDCTRDLLGKLKAEHHRNCGIHVIERSVNQLLKQADNGHADMEWESYDLIYCAGLFDYLSQRVCKKLVETFHKLSSPSGLVIATNVASTNPRIAWMEYMVEWNLVYRNDLEMLDLVPRDDKVLRSDLKSEATGVNLFLEIRKTPMDPFIRTMVQAIREER